MTPQTIARALNDIGTLSLVGVLVFRLAVLGPVRALVAEPARRRLERALGRLAGASLILALIGSLAWLVLQAAEMADEPLPGALAVLPTVITATHFGRVAVLRLGLLAVAGLCGFAATRAPWRSGVALATSAAAVAAQAWAGHAIGIEGTAGVALRLSQAIHMLAAGGWIGSLLPLGGLLAIATPGPLALAAARRFSAIGMACVGALAVTAAIGAWFLVGSVPALLGTPYGHDCLIKLGLLAAMLGLAAVNRFRLTPDLAVSGAALRTLRRTVGVEVALGLVILIVAAQLASTPPGTHDQVWWPLPRRFSTDALELPGVADTLALWGCGALLGLALIASAIWQRRLRVLGPVLGVVVLALCLREPVRLLSAEAFPTSFWQSPTGDTARAVADGARAFAANCAACHGAGGAGNGPLAKGLRVPPADLTAEHVYDHSDGDLFWWISNGMADGAMPGFAAALDETTRWDLIDFVHANADGARLAGIVNGAARPMRAPNFAVACPDGAAADLSGLRGRVLHLVFADPAAPERVRQLQEQVNESWVTIVLGLPASLDARPLCRADEPSARTAYALFDGRGSMPIEGAEFLIDAAGWLRASWRPGRTPSWSDPGVLRAAVARIAATVVAAPAVQHMHMHHH